MPSSCGNAADCDNPAPHTEHTENTEEKVEVFTPWYVNRSDRPVVTSNPATMAADGRTYDIAIGDSQGMSVERVVLIRAGSVTHAFDADQRLIQLDIVSNCISSVTVRSPYNPEAAPPGDYMVFALRKIATTGFKRWVPSVAVWTRIATPDRRSGAPILRYTGTPCTGANCPGWQRLDNNPKTVAIAAAGTHHDQALYQLHNDGWIWQYTGGPCLGASCAGWLRLDNNPKTAAIAAAGSQLYQLHNDGWILRYIGTPCAGDNCTGWQRLDRSAKTVAIAAAENQLYQLQNDGRILRYTGTPCSGESCLGWQRLDNNAKTVAIAAAGHEFYQLHNDGVIWRYTGTPCSGESCLGWQRLSVNTRTVAIAAASGQLYQLHNDGLIWRYTGTPCSGNSCLNDGQIWRYTGRPCSGNACFGWQLLSNSPDAESILAVGTQLFQRQKNGLIWRFTGTPCNGNSCPGWQQLNNNPSIAITAGATQLYHWTTTTGFGDTQARPATEPVARAGNNSTTIQTLVRSPPPAITFISAVATVRFCVMSVGRALARIAPAGDCWITIPSLRESRWEASISDGSASLLITTPHGFGCAICALQPSL